MSNDAQRLNSLTGLFSDWYWVLDEDLRYVSISGRGDERHGTTASTLLGQRRFQGREFQALDMSNEEFEALHVRGESYREVRARIRVTSGGFRYISISGEPLRDDRGRVTGYHGVTRDTTREHETMAALMHEQEVLALEHAVTRLLAESADAASGLVSVMRAACEAQGWDYGRYWRPEAGAEVLSVGESWSVADPVIEGYLERTRSMQFAPGAGLIGRVMQSGEPELVADLQADPRVLQVNLVRETGLRGACNFAVSFEGRAIGVLGFAGRVVRPADGRLLAALAAIGRQVGQFLTRNENQGRLRESEERFRSLTSLSSDWYWEQGPDLRYTRMEGRNFPLQAAGRPARLGRLRWEGPGFDRDSPVWVRHRRMLEQREAFANFEYSVVDPHGAVHWVSVSGEPIFSAGGAFTGYRGVGRDITQRVAQEQALRLAERTAALHARHQQSIATFGQFALQRRASDALVAEAVAVLAGQVGVAVLFDLTANDRITLNAAHGVDVTDCLGQSAPLVAGSAAQRMRESGGSVQVSADYLQASPEDWPWSGWMRRMRSGAFVPVSHDGHVHGMLGIYSTLAGAIGGEEVRFAESIGHMLSTALQRDRAEQRLAFLAQFDSLTGLPNRSLLEDRLRQTVAQSRRRQLHAGVLFVDLDRFKLINDTLGHESGDQVLRETARRLEQCLRAGDTVGRLSGDEFAVVLTEIANADAAALVAQKILDALAGRFDLAGSEAFVSASVGIAIYPGDGEDAESLLRHADLAMYQAKQSTRNAYRYFTASMNHRTTAKLQLNTDLRHAVERREFTLHYQPKVDLRSGALTGVEALLRWNHPQRGLVMPAGFISALEESGLILPVGEWVIEEACAQVRRWQLGGLRSVPVAVNLSAKQFRRRDLDRVIQRALAAAGLPAALLGIEITESSLADDPDDAVRILENLHAAGLGISVDDFGTGYSSLAYLMRLPLSALKIDRSFVRDAADSAKAASIVRAVIDLAHNLQFTVVAEGVETEAQAHFLRAHRCDQAQGYLFGRPVGPAEIQHWLLPAAEAGQH